jgi:iron complex outermembrane receptor protein
MVVEAATSTPVVGALVRLLEPRRADQTHDDGGFSFNGVSDGTYTLTVTRLGLRPVTRQIIVAGGRADSVRVQMDPIAVQLSATVTTGTIGEHAAEDVLSPTTIVDGAELDRRLKGTIAATLESQPGVSVTSLGPATSRPVVRGFSGDRVLVLEDGVRSGDLSSTSSDHAVSVDPATARQIEVVRGPMSLLYGSSALGGVVNVIREEIPATRDEHATGTISMEGSSANDGASIGAFGTASRGQLAFRAEGSARRAGDLRTALGRLDNSSLETSTAAIAGSVVRPRGYGGASYRFYDNSYGVPGGFVGGHEEGVDIDMRRHTTRAQGEFRPGASPFKVIHVNGAYTFYHHQEIESGGSLGTRFAQHVASGDAIARHGTHGALHEGAIGARYQYRDIRTGGTLRTPSTYDQSAALFIVEEIARGPMRIQGGARYDWAHYVPYARKNPVLVNNVAIPVDPRTFGSFSGSLGLLIDPGGGGRIGASVSRAYRTPDFNELYSNGPHLAAFAFEVGNPRIGQETGLGVDVFARLNRERVRGEVAVFRNRMHEYIYPRATGDIGLQGNRPKFQFTGREALLQGAEGGAEVTPLKRLTFAGTLSYVRGKFIGVVDSLPPDSAHGVFESRPGSHNLPLMPPLNGRLEARWEHSRAFATLGSRLARAQEDLGDFETRTAGYGTIDGSVGIRRVTGHRFHTVTLRVENAGNRAYRNHLSRTKEISPEAGRNVSLLYRLTF